jgi:hypothetical protein
MKINKQALIAQIVKQPHKYWVECLVQRFKKNIKICSAWVVHERERDPAADVFAVPMLWFKDLVDITNQDPINIIKTPRFAPDEHSDLDVRDFDAFIDLLRDLAKKDF